MPGVSAFNRATFGLAAAAVSIKTFENKHSEAVSHPVIYDMKKTVRRNDEIPMSIHDSTHSTYTNSAVCLSIQPIVVLSSYGP